ncbi:MAG TPA: helicase C-terminal domain-containing protein [Lacunisphaera sp.]|jgi:Rad3-related DNA helicase
MQFSLETKTAHLSVGEFAAFSLGPQESGGGGQGIWRAQLGQHWHNELRTRTEKELTTDGVIASNVQFEVALDGRLVHRGWTLHLNGRIDQLIGNTLREIKSVMRPLPAAEAELRADYPEYFRQLAAYTVLIRTAEESRLAAFDRTTLRAELIFVEAGSGLAQTIVLTPFDEALFFHQLDAIVDFLNLRLRATERRRALQFRVAFSELRAGQENIQAELTAALASSPTLLFEAPTGYGKTGCVLEFALHQMRSGRFARMIWLTGKSTGQLQVVRTLEQMTVPDKSNVLGSSRLLPFWQVRNKAEHCINHTFHCVRDGCSFLAGCEERWPQSGLAKFYLDDAQPHDLETLREAGREARICPYEITRTALAFNDVWIGDFNYVFAPGNRGIFFEQPGFNPEETLLVVDEAHNLPSRVAGAYSHRATGNDSRLLLAELDHLQAPRPLIHAVEEWAQLIASLRPADSLDPAVEDDVRELAAKLANLVSTLPLDYVALGPRHSESLWQFPAIDNFLNDKNLTKLLWVSRESELEFTCVDAAAAIGETLQLFGGTILMSATLQPYREFAISCGMEAAKQSRSAAPDRKPSTDPVAPSKYTTLTALTPWRSGAYDIAVDLRVDTSYRQRASYYGTTAATIEALHQAAQANQPRGSTSAVAVFFPSYAYADAVLRALEQSGSLLRVAMQPRLPDLTAQAAWIEENLVLSDSLFLVLGSSFAEGIDLLGGRVTHAMVVGPALPEVNAVQKARVNEFATLGRDAAFRRVYQIPGLQKVNQALGRLVRAPGHRAKVLLHCKRFADPTYASLLATDYQFFREVTDESALTEWLATPATGG